VALFDASQQLLDRRTGAINTVLLITSSYFVVRAVASVKADDSALPHAGCSRRWVSGLASSSSAERVRPRLCGGHHPEHQHLLHVLPVPDGLPFPACGRRDARPGIIAQKVWTGGYSAAEHTGVETGATYWHMVDMVWIVLFPLVYVIH